MGDEPGSRAGAGPRGGRDLDTETIRPTRASAVAGEPLVPGLTLLCHPDPSRVGEQAHLHDLASGRAVEVSRTAPELRLVGAAEGRPLGDPYLSRRPLVRLERLPDGIALAVEAGRGDVLLEGEPVAERAVVAEADLGRGVVLELAGRVALLLHALGMPRSAEPDLGLVGQSESIARLRAEIRRAAAVSVPVLLRGESGTGKELVARAVHELGQRRAGPFLAVNMAAVPPPTAASELFGHLRGAFTGASRDSPGLLVRASGGSLLLDEIGDTPGEVQGMLLRALETGEVQPVGGGGRGRAVDVRLLAATETDLEAAVAEGRFRLALYHRLAGWELRVPPLRDRRDDVARLLVHFLDEQLAELGAAHRLAPPADRLAPVFLSAAVVSRLVRHDWPGNVRQLRNVARLLAIGSAEAPAVEIGPEVDRLLGAEAEPTSAEGSVDWRAERGEPISAEALAEALRASGFRPGEAAARLGVGRTTVYRLMERHGTVRKAADIDEAELRRVSDECAGDLEAMAERLEVSVRALQLRLRRIDR